MTRLSITLLGSFVVRLDDEPLTGFAYDKVRALLAYLAVESTRPSRRERLVGLLWPDLPEAKGFSNLRTSLYDLRNILRDRETHPPFLAISHTALQLNPEGATWVDVAAFRSGIAAIETLPDPTTDGAAYEAMLSGAIDLYGGDLLQGFSVDSELFEDWTLMQREALHLQMLDGLERLVAFHRERGNHERVLTYARRQVELEPLRERAHRHVMNALVALGRRAEAVAQYEISRRVLREKLGIEPEPATQALLALLRAEGQEAVSEQDAPLIVTRSDPGAWTPGMADGHGVPAVPMPGEPGSERSEGAGRQGLADQPGPRTWSPETVARTVRSAEELRRRAGATGELVVMAAAQAALDMARAAGGVGAEALGHLYAGVVLANTTGPGFEASLAHLGRALALAQVERMPGMAPEILRYLGLSPLDEEVDGEAGVLSQALALYRQLGHRVGESRVLGVLALAGLDAGNLTAARGYAEEGIALAREMGDRHEEGVLSRVLGEAELLQGAYGLSRRSLQAALACFHEVGAPEGEAAALRTFGALLDVLGAYDRARQVVARSFAVLPPGSGPAGVMEGWHTLALVALHTGDHPGAGMWLEKTLALLDSLGDGRQRSGYPRLRSAVMTVRGQVLARQGRFDEAAAAYREAVAVRQRGRWPGVGAEARAGLAELAVLQNRSQGAFTQIEGVLPQLEVGELAGALEPVRIYRIGYRVLQDCGDPRAQQVLARAHAFLLARSASIEDAGLQRSYLENVTAHREVAAAVAGEPGEEADACEGGSVRR